MTGLNELLERVQKATGEDMLLSNDIWRSVRGQDLGSILYHSTPDVTASIDAALALVKRALPPDANLALKQHADGKYFHVEVETDEGDFTAYNHPSLPLAILAALLSALIAKESYNDQ